MEARCDVRVIFISRLVTISPKSYELGAIPAHFTTEQTERLGVQTDNGQTVYYDRCLTCDLHLPV